MPGYGTKITNGNRILQRKKFGTRAIYRGIAANFYIAMHYYAMQHGSWAYPYRTAQF
jgi:hypothetical protein